MPLVDFDTPSLHGLADAAVMWGRKAVYAEDPLTQIVVNLVIIVAMLLSSSVGFVVGIPIALAAMFFAGVGVVRLVIRWLMRLR